MESCLLNLLILIDCFLCNTYICVLFESLSHVINQESYVYLWNLRKIYLVHFLQFWNLLFLRFQNFQKVNSVNLSQISLLIMWLLVQIQFRSSFNFETNFLEAKTFFKKLESRFLVETTKIENIMISIQNCSVRSQC